MPLPPYHLLLHLFGLTFLVQACPCCPAKEAIKWASISEYAQNATSPVNYLACHADVVVPLLTDINSFTLCCWSYT